MGKLAIILLSIASLAANAKTLSCNYISSEMETEEGFLTNVTAKFNCGGVLTEFVGDNIYVSCKPQFALSEFTENLVRGEAVRFNTSVQTVSSIDGSRRQVTMVRSAVSGSGTILEPQTIIQHGKPVLCDPTQIEVR